MSETVLVRYGTIPEVARFHLGCDEPVARETPVVVRSHRGVELGTLLQDAAPDRDAGQNGSSGADFMVLRRATADDLAAAATLR
ncbi:MAG: hypothetical protein ACREIV_07070, partial [Planctomycetaceae bacterium]